MSSKISVSAADIAAGRAGDCFRCPVAIALARATGDGEANVYERDFEMWIEVGGRHTRAPHEVREFVHGFDGQPRTEDGRPDTGHEDYDPPGPFEFELPDRDGPEWQGRCYCCEELFAPSELDDEGFCQGCASPS